MLLIFLNIFNKYFFMSNILFLIIIRNLYNYVGSKTNENRENILKNLLKSTFEKKTPYFDVKKTHLIFNS